VLVLDQVRQNGGQGADLLKTVATQQALTSAQTEAALFAKNGWRSVGRVLVRRLGVRSASLQANPEDYVVPEVILDTCEDVGGGDLLDGAGKSVRPTDVPVTWKTTVWVRLYPVESGPSKWIVARDENEGVPSC
jgi:hypothetical protein